MPLQTTTEDIVGSWRAPETEGVELGYYFYPDGVLILRNPRHKGFAMRGAWTLEAGGRLVISDVVDPNTTRPEDERELIRAERHNISIMEITRDSMVWQTEDATWQRSAPLQRVGNLSRQYGQKERLAQALLARITKFPIGRAPPGYASPNARSFCKASGSGISSLGCDDHVFRLHGPTAIIEGKSSPPKPGIAPSFTA